LAYSRLPPESFRLAAAVERRIGMLFPSGIFRIQMEISRLNLRSHS
jgi:hypothetical protein